MENGVFIKCSNLKEIIIPEGIKEIGDNVFQNCVNLKKITFPKSLEKIGKSSFSYVNIDNLQISSENINFINQNGILLGENKKIIVLVTTSAIQNGNFTIPETVEKLEEGVLIAFSQIKRVIVPESVKEINAVFFPSGIEEILIDESNNYFISINGQVCSKDKKILYMCYKNEETITIEEGISTIPAYIGGNNLNNVKVLNLPNSLEMIGAGAFNVFNSLTYLKLGKNVNNIDSFAFAYNDSLQNIEIDNENLVYMSENGAIYSKDKTKLVLVCNVNTESFEILYGVVEIEARAFFRKTKLKEVLLPETITIIKEEAFRECDILERLEIPSSVSVIKENAFIACKNLREILIKKESGSILGSPWGCVYGDRAIKWNN
ncbi:MAG: leucine-rich repeat domain-containing protein [Clostridia bacterium]|nr:leucine-rich repeat domain-containing protein [Clostridia bacterium]